MPNTVKLHRVFPCSPDKLYRAFLDADARTRWLPPNGFTAHMHHQEAKVGGAYKMSFTNFTTGNGHSFGGKFLELKPGEKIAYSAVFDDPNLPGEMVTTATFRKVMVGTEVHIEQTGVPDMIPLEACYLGWQESLVHLATLVNPNIPD